MAAYIPYPRANEPIAIPPRRTGGSFVSALNNGRNSFRITQARKLRLIRGEYNEPVDVRDPYKIVFCYHKINDSAISLVFLSIRHFCHTLYTNNKKLYHHFQCFYYLYYI